MGHGHGHGSGASAGRPLGVSIALTSAFVVVEAAAGWWANSLSLLSDAGHNFADVLALVLAWYAIRVAKRPADARRTFGYHRAAILAALANAVSLVVLAVLIFVEGAQRLRSPGPVESGVMIVVALIAVLLNGAMGLWLRAEAKDDLNMRGAYMHMLGDAVSALGVIAAGIYIAVTGQTIADPLVSLFIGALILWSSWDILAESVDVLLEAVPRGFELSKLTTAVRAVPGVADVHDVHVWTVNSGLLACSCHIVVGDRSLREGEQLRQLVVQLLHHDFAIGHATIQLEAEACAAEGSQCSMQPVGHVQHHSE